MLLQANLERNFHGRNGPREGQQQQLKREGGQEKKKEETGRIQEGEEESQKGKEQVAEMGGGLNASLATTFQDPIQYVKVPRDKQEG
jgi:hypothetical protein